MASRGIWRMMSARTRRSLALTWSALFVLSLLLQYLSFAMAPGALAAALTVNLDQWANQAPAAWQNGDLNGNNSTYHEGDVVPFRLAIEGLTAGSHSFHINYDFTAGGHKAYDFLATYNVTENATPCSAGGGGVSSLCPSLPAAVTGQFGDDGRTINGKTVVGAYGATGRLLTMYGGTIDPIPAPVCSGSTDANSTCDYTITFTTTGSAAFFLWGGHLARSDYWNDPADPDGAGQVSGAPWHMRTQDLDGSGNKNQDRSIQPSALVQLPALTITKTADAASVSAGDPIGFTVTITNTGTGAAGGLSFTDALPAGTGVSWTISPTSTGWSIGGSPPTQTLVYSPTSLAAGTSTSVHVTSATTSASCKTYSNTATVQGTNIAAIQASASTTVNCATLTITKVADATSVVAGATIGYTITLTNTGVGTAHGVKVSDTVPTNAGLSWAIDAAGSSAGWTLSGGILSYGGTNGVDLAPGSVHVHITSPTTAATCGTVNNTATASSTNDGSPSVGPVAITVNCPALAITKTADAASVSAGDPIGFTVTITNNGAGAATGLSFSDALPAGTGVSWSINPASTGWSISGSAPTQTLVYSPTSLAAGASTSVHVVSSTTSASCKAYSNVASVQASNSATVQASATVTVNCGALAITKTADAASVIAGATIGYTITLTNTGVGTVHGVKVSDTVPTNAGLSWAIDAAGSSAGWTLSGGILSYGGASGVDLAPGSVHVHITSPTTAATCGTVNNSAAASSTSDGSPSVGPVAITVGCPVLTVSKAFAGSTGGIDPILGVPLANIGDTLHYTLTYSGSGSLTNAVITDVLPVGLDYVAGSAAGDASFTFIGYDAGTRTLTWKAATLPNPASGSVSYNVTVLAAAPDQPQPLTNTATIDSDQTAPNSATAQVAALAPPLAATGTPGITPPPTDTFTPETGSSNPGFTLMLILLGLAGLAASIGFITPVPAQVRRRDRQG
jgi:uncharacterized repeat protein (TIGR01451 family)